jgi:hypothetical protein
VRRERGIYIYRVKENSEKKACTSAGHGNLFYARLKIKDGAQIQIHWKGSMTSGTHNNWTAT